MVEFIRIQHWMQSLLFKIAMFHYDMGYIPLANPFIEVYRKYVIFFISSGSCLECIRPIFTKFSDLVGIWMQIIKLIFVFRNSKAMETNFGAKFEKLAYTTFICLTCLPKWMEILQHDGCINSSNDPSTFIKNLVSVVQKFRILMCSSVLNLLLLSLIRGGTSKHCID